MRKRRLVGMGILFSVGWYWRRRRSKFGMFRPVWWCFWIVV